MAGDTLVKVENRELKLSNLDKIFYPEVGFTKAQVIDYYTRIAPALLPHIKGRLLTLKRYPNGVEGEFFYEKRCPPHRPDWISTKTRWSESSKRDIDYCVIDSLPSLVWAANLANLELHTSLSVAKDPNVPTMLAFDLDPGPPAGIIECCEVALVLKDELSSLGMSCYPKTSGSKGMQIYVPLNTKTSFDKTKPFAKALAEELERRHPDLIVSKMKKDLRKRKVFIDWSQNDDYKTTVCVYSLRAKPRPFVSTPIEWKEVRAAIKKADAELLAFDFDQVLKRAKRKGDLFAPVLVDKQKLPNIKAIKSKA